MFSLSWIGFMSYLNFDAINHDAKALHRMKFLFSDYFEVTCEFCMAGMDNDFHKANNVTSAREM
jgi:hypothetical protein